MSALGHAAAILALTWATVLAWLAIGAAIRRAQLQRRFRARAPVELAGRRVLLVRPCAGAEPGLLDNLVSVRTLVTTAELTIVMSVDEPDDEARPIIAQAVDVLREAGLDARAELLAGRGPNRKAGMLAQLLDQAEGYDAIVNVDSNVELDDFELDALLGPLLGPVSGETKIGAAWAPWFEARTHAGIGPRMSEAVLGASLTAWPLLCAIYPFGLVGKIWAAKPETLRACGFESLPDYLGEDLEMANRLRAAGWGIAVAPVLGRARGHASSVAAVNDRFGRWMLATRGQRPWLMPSYPLLFFATPLVLVLAGLGFVAAPTLAVVAVGLAVFGRLLVALVAQYWSGRRVGLIAALLEAGLADVALARAWWRGMSSREVEWRGHRLRVGKDGRLHAIE